jgi:hypothetical protein
MRFVLLLMLSSAAALPQTPSAALRDSLTFHAPFDKGTEAAFAKGDARIYTAASYKDLSDARAGLHQPAIVHEPKAGRFGGALRFQKKNTHAIYFRASGNVPFDPKNWTGTVSFWLSLDPDKELEPGFCDPIQITDKAYNNSAIWVDFTKDEKPRHFRLGIFGELKEWNPSNVPADKNPDFTKRLVTVTKPPFGSGKWTHVAIVYERLGSGEGTGRLYLNGELQGTTPRIREGFNWDLGRATLRLGVNYVGLFDELAVFGRALSAGEVKALYDLRQGVAGLR